MNIVNVKFNYPYTTVAWDDGTETVVKCENETFDPEKGLSMAISKKFFGNKGSYYDQFKKWIPNDNTFTFITKCLDRDFSYTNIMERYAKDLDVFA